MGITHSRWKVLESFAQGSEVIWSAVEVAGGVTEQKQGDGSPQETKVVAGEGEAWADLKGLRSPSPSSMLSALGFASCLLDSWHVCPSWVTQTS